MKVVFSNKLIYFVNKQIKALLWNIYVGGGLQLVFVSFVSARGRFSSLSASISNLLVYSWVLVR